MPTSTKHFRNDTAVIPVHYSGEVVSVTYAVSRVTPQWLVSTVTEPIKDCLASVLLSWDLLADDDQPLMPPPVGDPTYLEQLPQERTAEALQAAYEAAWRELLFLLPQMFLRTVLEAIVNYTKFGDTPGANSLVSLSA